MNNNLVVITGQTATGKTTLAVKYAQEHNGEIVNADSRQVYKHLDIITGKDLGELKLSGVPYHLFDLVDPKDSFSSHEYVEAARPVILDIRSRRKTPVIVGGSYLYLKHLLYGFDVAVEPNRQLRDELEGKSVAELQKLLAPRPDNINDSDWNNPRRLIRRIEIAKSAVDLGLKISPLRKRSTPEGGGVLRNQEHPGLWPPLLQRGELIGLKHKDRQSLEVAIKSRIDKRIEEGAVREVEQLLKQGYTKNDPGLQTIGYTQIIAFLKGEISMESAVKNWTNKEIQYAKRQYTFMKKDSRISWVTAPY